MNEKMKKVRKYLLIGATSIATIIGGGTLTACSNVNSNNEMEDLKSKIESLEENYEQLQKENENLKKEIGYEIVQKENQKIQTYETQQSYVTPLKPVIQEKIEDLTDEAKSLSIDEIINTVQFDRVVGRRSQYGYELLFYLGNNCKERMDFKSTEEYIDGCLKISSLQSFEVCEVDLTNSSTLEKIITILKLNSKMEAVRFYSCQLNDNVMELLANALSKEIISLNACCNNLTNLEFLKYGFSELKSLELSTNALSDINGLFYLENPDILQTVSFDNNLIVDSSPLKRFSNLEAAWLINNYLDDPNLLPNQCEILAIRNNNWDENDIELLEKICTNDKIAGEYHYYAGYWYEELFQENNLSRTLNK